MTARLNSLGEAWTGGSSDKAIAAAMPMVTWLQTASTQAKTRALQATAQAAAYTQAMATTPSLPEIAANHITTAVLTATNFFGINTVPIAFNEIDYFIRMWTQAAVAMDVYQAETLANTLFDKIEPMTAILDPAMSQGMTSSPMMGMAVQMTRRAELGPAFGDGRPGRGVERPDAAADPADAADDIDVQPDGQRPGGTGSGLADDEGAQMGLLGASPLSNHPLGGWIGRKRRARDCCAGKRCPARVARWPARR